MLWLNIYLSDLDNEAFACAETADIGTWLRLMRYCCTQENGGLIKGAKAFDNRKFGALFRLSKPEIHEKSDLWAWKGNDLFVSHFPNERLKIIKKQRVSALKANEVRWGNRNAKPNPISHTESDASAHARSDATPNPKTESGKERKGKGKERKGREGNAPDGAEAHSPTLSEVLSFFASRGAPSELAKKFFHHYQANGWVQGGGQPVVSWESQGEKWIVGEPVETAGAKNHDEPPPPAAFN